MKSKFKFKVGDLVEIDYQSKRNRDGAFPDDKIYEISEVYEQGLSKTPFVKLKGGDRGYFQERFKLSKNAIIYKIISEL